MLEIEWLLRASQWRYILDEISGKIWWFRIKILAFTLRSVAKQNWVQEPINYGNIQLSKFI